MKEEILSPSVEHGEEADLGAEMFGIGSDGGQGLGRGSEQNAGLSRPKSSFGDSSFTFSPVDSTAFAIAGFWAIDTARRSWTIAANSWA